MSKQCCVQCEHLHAAVLLLNILQVLLELLQLDETIFRQLSVLLQLTVHLLKLCQGKVQKCSRYSFFAVQKAAL